MIDYKPRRVQCDGKNLKLSDFLVTCLTVAAVLILFVAVFHELSRVGGALDQSFGATVQEMQSAKK